MPDTLTFIGPILLILFGAVIVLFAVMAAKARDLRYQQLSALAQRRQLNFFPEGMQLKSDTFRIFGRDDGRPFAEFTEFFPFFKQGSSQRIRPALIGKDAEGTHWYLFDFTYEVKNSNDDSTTSYTESVVVAMLPMQLPTMSLTPENFAHRLGKRLGVREMQVESEEFNQRFFISTSDQKMSLDLLHPLAIELLLKMPTFEWQMAGPFVMLNLSGELSADDYEGLMGCLKRFLDTIPGYYRQDHGY